MLDVKRNLTTMTDFYELTMSAGYLDEGYVDKIAVFDMFFRRVPDGGGYAIMAGLQQFIDAVDHLEFTQEDIDYLRTTGAFNEKFLNYLANFKLHCNIWAIEEGMPIFPQEPIVTVEGPAIECQLLETLLLVTFNHQCLIATKANRIVRSAAGRPVMEFGARRAQGYDAAYFGARASYIGGCGSTSMILGERDEHEPHAGSFLPGSIVDILSFDNFLIGSWQRPVGFDISHRGFVGTSQKVPVRNIQIDTVCPAPLIERADLFPLFPL